ncbi:PhoD-like phosphatase-domain-containing protein [Geopyxis carbonaria]|nr:PhoD-like phosphatase-domain-containing protein [Geopyxis carbonaria]
MRIPHPTRALALFLLPAALANLSYLSPSTNHPHFAIPGDHSPPSLHKRSLSSSQPLTFTHGVASGDPYDTSVILWTRAVPANRGIDADSHLYRPTQPSACVAWEVSDTAEFTTLVAQGRTATGPEVDYTVKVEATGLQPWTHYWYRFTSCSGDGPSSPVGRTKTLPHPSDPMTNTTIRLAVYSCSNYVTGHFNAYGMSARRDSVDLVLHLGDYIYETPFPTTLPDRIPRPLKDTIQLVDYRQRLAIHRTDPDLLLSHASFPWIAVWDDHEVADNGWRGGSGASLLRILESTPWNARQAAGLRAYWEWMPLRRVAAAPSTRIWRSFRVGTLIDLAMLDTRYWARDASDVPAPANLDEERTMMGADQEAWLEQLMAASNATWFVIGQQVQFSALNESAIPSASSAAYLDGWSGYPAARRRVLGALERHAVRNPVVLTGDYHALWAADLARPGLRGYNHTTGAGSIGVEFAGTAVTSPSGYGELGYDEAAAVSRRLVQENAVLKWAEGYYRGYYELLVSQEAVEAVYWAVPDVSRRSGEEREIGRWTVKEGGRRLERPFKAVREGAGGARICLHILHDVTTRTRTYTYTYTYTNNRPSIHHPTRTILPNPSLTSVPTIPLPPGPLMLAYIDAPRVSMVRQFVAAPSLPHHASGSMV